MFSLLSKYKVYHSQFYSTTCSPYKIVAQSVADYLVDNLGFSQQKALSVCTKLPANKFIDFKDCDNANSVVLFLKQHDFDDTHLRKIVSLYPPILFSKLDKTLKPRFKLLQDLGFSGSDLITVISSNPTFPVKHMKHVISNLRTILGSDENMLKFLKRSFFTLSSSLENLVANVALLNNDYGLDNESIRKCIVLHPSTFLTKPKFFRNVVIRVEEELGIPHNSKMFVYGIHFLTRSNKENFESKCQVLKSFGWTDAQVSDLVRRSPCSLTSSDESLRKKLEFLVNELGFQPDFLAKRSAFFSCSLEKRMWPRHRVLLILKEKGLLDYNFHTAILKSEQNFLKLLKPFQDQVPGLLEIYENSKG